MLLTLALLFATATATYSVIWLFQIRHGIAFVGTTSLVYSRAEGSMRVGGVVAGGTAEWAGLQRGDRIVAINGRTLETTSPYYQGFIVAPTDSVKLTVERAGYSKQLTLRLPLRGKGTPTPTWLEALLLRPIACYPLFFLVVGLAVLFLRFDNADAWRLALLFAGFIGLAPLYEGGVPPFLRGFAVFYQIAMLWLSYAMFNYFFAVFPARSPLDQRLPWVKKVLVGVSLAVGVPTALRCLVAGGSLPVYAEAYWPGGALLRMVQSWQRGLALPDPHDWLSGGPFMLLCWVLGFASLVWNSLRPVNAEARRKTRVIVWGAVIGVSPLALLMLAGFVRRMDIPPALFLLVVVLFASVLPLSVAYAVVKHRVLDLPVLVKRSARYLLVQRGFVILHILLSAAVTVLFALALSRFFRSGARFWTSAGLTGAVLFGSVLAMTGVGIHRRVTYRIDRAFFRSAYDARQVLERLAVETRAAKTRQEVSSLLEREVKQALHPRSMAVYLRASEDRLVAAAHGRVPGLENLPIRSALLAEIARRGQPWQVPPPETGGTIQSDPSLALLAPLQPECLVPMLGHDGGLTGLLVLGPRLSEESYSREDRRLLASVATQAGTTLDNIRLAEQMAERLEAERRAARDMEIAKQVQARLFPQKLPALRTLEYVGECIQARQVGGDYYDFLDLGPGRMGIVMADIAGKGISGALLMANLQANLRSQYAVALEELSRLLQSVNRLFYENTSEESYATLFFADYDDASRRWRYANCGHNPPILMRVGGQVERLAATTTVVGLFTDWECPIREVTLEPGDVLVVYTDGVTEAANADGEEFGEERLLEVVQAHRLVSVGALLKAISAEVQRFSYGEQTDDLTLVVVKSK
jgi:sigma-B regulation protein RsbU (phosphoserine phosphatase)